MEANVDKRNKRDIVFIAVIISLFIVVNVFINRNNNEKYGDYNGTSEFMSTIDCAPYFDENPEGSFTISFDIRTDRDGEVKVMLYDNDGERYWFTGQYVNSTTEFSKCEIVVTPQMINEDKKAATLTFNGMYGTGVIPHVKNIVVNKTNQ